MGRRKRHGHRSQSEASGGRGGFAWLDAASGRWKEPAPIISGLLVLDENAFRLERWLDALRPVRKVLLGPLEALYRDRTRDDDERFRAAIILEQYAADDPHVLVELVKDADLRRFAVLLPVLQQRSAAITGLLEEELKKQPGRRDVGGGQGRTSESPGQLRGHADPPRPD